MNSIELAKRLIVTTKLYPNGTHFCINTKEAGYPWPSEKLAQLATDFLEAVECLRKASNIITRPEELAVTAEDARMAEIIMHVHKCTYNEIFEFLEKLK